MPRELSGPSTPATYGALRVVALDEPYVPSVKRTCAACGEAVWVDERSTEWADACTIECTVCLGLDHG